jgi:hypothetical protein
VWPKVRCRLMPSFHLHQNILPSIRDFDIIQPISANHTQWFLVEYLKKGIHQHFNEPTTGKVVLFESNQQSGQDVQKHFQGGVGGRCLLIDE